MVGIFSVALQEFIWVGVAKVFKPPTKSSWLEVKLGYPITTLLHMVSWRLFKPESNTKAEAERQAYGRKNVAYLPR